jgi:hypothetical protein
MNLKRKTREEQEQDGKDCGNYKLFIKLNRLGEQMDDISVDYVDVSFEGSYCRMTQANKQHLKELPFN